MRVQYRTGATGDARVQRVVERETRLLDRRLSHIADELRMLTVSIERHLRDDTRTATLVLKLPDRQMAAAGRGAREDAALRDAFADLRDQLDRHLARERREPAKRREGKFHRDKAALAAQARDAALGWPPDPPAADEQARQWGRTVC